MNLQRVLWAFGVFLVAAALVVCLLPGPAIPAAFEWNDKLSHIVGHGALAIYFAGLVPRRNWWKIFVFLLSFGVAVEIAQFYMHAGREGDPRDVLANSTGALLGLIAARLGLARWSDVVAWLSGRRATQ